MVQHWGTIRLNITIAEMEAAQRRYLIMPNNAEQTISRKGVRQMSDFRKYLKRQMEDPKFADEWESLEPEYQIMRAIVEARRKSHLTQKQLSQATGINQADISKMETGNCNPSLRTLNRLAEGMGMILSLEFVPMKEKKG